MSGDKRFETLRKKAEHKLREMPERLRNARREEVEELVHDLNVHQIELEIQNEELRNVQSELESSRDAYAQLFDEAPVGYLILDVDGHVQMANSTLSHMTGRSLSDLHHRPFVKLIVDDDQRIFLSRFNALMKTPDGKSLTVRMKRTDGQSFWARLQAGSSRMVAAMSNGDTDRLLMIVSDVTDEVEAREALDQVKSWLEVETRLQSCFLSFDNDALFAEVLEVVKDVLESPLGYLGYIDAQGNLVCPSMTRGIFDQCQIPNKTITFPRSSWGGLWGRSLQEKVTMVANGGLEVPRGHMNLSCALAVPLMFNDALVGQIVVANRKGGYGDEHTTLLEKMAAVVAPILHEQRRATHAEDQLRQAQKMESVGRLAGGVAHDFNNLLTAILGNIEMAELDLPRGHRSADSMSEARLCAERAADLVQRLLSFSRKQMVYQKTFDLTQLVQRVHRMLERVVSEDVVFALDLPDHPTWVRMDLNQIEQILVNLVINARDAMPDGGLLTIKLRQVELPPSIRAKRPDLDEEIYLELSVADTGHGMPPEVCDHIFEPFFTTKEPGIGTGLGLSVVYGSVMQSGGHIDVESTPDEGTVFRVLLPTVAQPDTTSSPPGAAAALRPRAGVVMVVDDEAALRELYRRVLTNAGYEVVAARDGLDALALIEQRKEPFDLLITDVVMPRMNGAELAARARKHHPGLEVLYTSGYSENAIVHHGVLDEGVNFLKKPYKPTVL
ncbi:MAG: response regulator, partial [Myxococcota bacterium]